MEFILVLAGGLFITCVIIPLLTGKPPSWNP